MVLVHKEPKIINDVAKFPISLCHGCKDSHKQLFFRVQGQSPGLYIPMTTS